MRFWQGPIGYDFCSVRKYNLCDESRGERRILKSRERHESNPNSSRMMQVSTWLSVADVCPLEIVQHDRSLSKLSKSTPSKGGGGLEVAAYYIL